jgi:hypothetical protein
VNEWDVLFDNKPQTIETEFEYLYNLVINYGDNEKLIRGCFENYLTIPFNDPLMTRVRSHSLILSFVHSKSREQFRLMMILLSLNRREKL